MKNLLTALVVAAAAVPGFAGTFVGTSSLSATVQVAGVRTGASGTNFFNVESYANTTFADFGVIDFPAASFGAVTGTITGLKLTLDESDAPFTSPDALHFYFTTNTAASIAAATSTLKYNSGNGSPAALVNNGIDPALGGLVDLGAGTFSSTGATNTGQIDNYSLTVNASSIAYVQNALSGNGTIRLIAVTDESVQGQANKGAATFFGSTGAAAGTPGNPPTLTITTQAVPEPISMSLLGLGVVGLITRRKKA